MNKYNLLFLIAFQIPLILRLGLKYDIKRGYNMDYIDYIYFILFFILLIIFNIYM